MLASRLLPFRTILPRTLTFHSAQRVLLSTQNSPTVHASFFKKYNFERYTFEPGKPPEEEFQRLVKAREWGTKRTAKHRELLHNAVRLAEFFERFEEGGEEVGRYIYSPGSESAVEFRRLCTVKGWDEGRIAVVRKEYDELTGVASQSREGDASNSEASREKEKVEGGTSNSEGDQENVEGGTSNSEGNQEKEWEKEEDGASKSEGNQKKRVFRGHTAIAKFFVENQCPGYSYSYRSSEVEFRELAEVREAMWKAGAGGRERKGPYKKTGEYEDLRREFEVAIEESFDAFLRVERKSLEEKETRPWETLVELLKVGKAPIGRTEAIILIKEIHINIYDLTNLFEIDLPPSMSILRGLLTTESQRIQQLRFPNLVMLAAYSALTDKVYSLDNAKKNGTLVLLLQRLRSHFHEFEHLIKMTGRGNIARGTPISSEEARRLLRQRFPTEWEELDREIAQKKNKC
ncbi:hypothetical protein HOY80DRAFT_1137043 [Tuber brumale]|nr:hypothetical protein HOY80DRAFT_1137043 [Tuber brumale]